MFLLISIDSSSKRCIRMSQVSSRRLRRPQELRQHAHLKATAFFRGSPGSRQPVCSINETSNMQNCEIGKGSYTIARYEGSKAANLQDSEIDMDTGMQSQHHIHPSLIALWGPADLLCLCVYWLANVTSTSLATISRILSRASRTQTLDQPCRVC